jgi:hypothetical protein
VPVIHARLAENQRERRLLRSLLRLALAAHDEQSRQVDRTPDADQTRQAVAP